MSPVVEREHIVFGGPAVPVPLVQTPAGFAEWAAESMAARGVPPCEECGEVDHFADVRLYPRPDGRRPEAIDELKQVCSCCAFGVCGKPERGLLWRLRGEQAEGDDHDITIEVLMPDGRWA
ncbi:hypothetical protein VSH64_25065 [Amycolatopsis rhabdoformis]|uniref:HNH endonuclease n=1 Tax=Amycolatopsis rhabdoformis TaxID=1448059 RepID=A0ABZ1HXN9_9PSEU|nr:hypothetical protein [Amycolatopsis rhabdoformis]WSE26149.1 hypothetical protein VSH64_25065 [Amycolatopsis rhabdoformis]